VQANPGYDALEVGKQQPRAAVAAWWTFIFAQAEARWEGITRAKRQGAA